MRCCWGLATIAMAIILTRSCRLEKKRKERKRNVNKGGMSSIIHDRWWGCVLSLCNNRPQSIRSDPFQTTCWLIVNRITRLEGDNSKVWPLSSLFWYYDVVRDNLPIFLSPSTTPLRIQNRNASVFFPLYIFLNRNFISTCVVSLRAL